MDRAGKQRRILVKPIQFRRDVDAGYRASFDVDALMPILPFGEYRPDVSDYQGQHSKNIKNVVPHGDGYGPFSSFGKFSSELPGSCRGIFYARKNDGSIIILAGTANQLFSLD